MRVLLVRPPVSRQTIGLKNVMLCEPLELEYVAAGLREHEVQILDLLVERGIERRLRKFRPDVVGTSCYITGVDEAIGLCRAVKRWNSLCRTVIGGVHAACDPQAFCDPAVDCVVRCDGTSALPEVLEAWSRGRPLEEIPGLALPCAEGLRLTAARPYMPPPDTLPFPRRDLVAHLAHRYYYLFHQPVALLKTTWGCWYRCRFCCTWGITGGVAYSRSPESIVEELAAIGQEDVYIVDDIFLIQPDRLRRIAELIQARGIRKKYLVYGRSDFIADHESLIAEWAQLGLTAVFIGLEASTDAELQSMEKRCTVEKNRQAIEVLRRNGVDVYGSLITQPDYSAEDWERLWRFIEENGLYYLNISPLTPLPGSLAWDELHKRLTVDPRAHALFDLTHVLLPTRMPLREYYRALLRLYRKSCLDPRRAARLTQRTRPALWSRRYLRLWWGAWKVGTQISRAHTHHTARSVRPADVTGL
ncbi:MAG: cobalamin-dependent protein [Candidatus Eisenbacteria bacterium]|nr:cobalamin-dependent protein [Candidatus Eisenbacteria bacterium]